MIFAKEQQYFVMVDEFVAKKGIASALQWNIHSWNEFEINGKNRMFWIRRRDSVLRGHFMHHKNGFFTLTEGWDPPPMEGKDNAQWRQQYHLRFTPSGIDTPRRNLGVVLCFEHAHLQLPVVETLLDGKTEVARVGEDVILVNQSNGIDYQDHQSDALMRLVIGDQPYEVDDDGIVSI